MDTCESYIPDNYKFNSSGFIEGRNVKHTRKKVHSQAA